MFFDQTTENYLRGHVRAFQAWSGAPRVILYDNLRSAVLERRGDEIHFNPRLLELAAHYHCVPRPCQVRAGNQKGRVDRAIRYVRDSFWAGRVFTTLAECNRQALVWRDKVAQQRPWPDDSARTVAQAFREEQPRLLPLPIHLFNTDRIETVRSRKTIYVRFDLNDYSIPPEAVGRTLTLLAFQGADAVGTVHDMRFVFLDNDTRMLFATAYDGDWDAYIDDFATKIPTAMDVLFCNAEGWPGIRSPKVKDWIVKHQVAAEAWYVANPDLTVAETRRLKKIEKALEEFLDKIQ